MNIRTNQICAWVIAWMACAPVFSQDGVRSTSSMNLQPGARADVTIPFSVAAEGKRYQPTWGLDQAWISEQNMRKGVNHMGKANVGIGRSAFRFTRPLTNDSVLDKTVIDTMRIRSRIFDIADSSLPIVFTADQEAYGGPDATFVTNKSAKVAPWAAMINSHVHWMQQNTKHPIVGVSPFNEPDYWTVEEGATTAKQRDVAKTLKESYPRFSDIAIVGGNTLNNDNALTWYTTGKQYYDWGNTHQLAGSFDKFVAFYQQLEKDGKVGYADEMHNVGEAMIGLEYGMTVGIWWGFDSRARGEFCDISRHGERIAYGEHRNNWTAASVYRHDDGRVKAFIGSSERQAVTTSYQFLSTDREVYFDGHGPLREYRMEMPGGTGYQKGQTNAERVIDVTWGEDVPPCTIGGTCRFVNKATETFIAASSGNLLLQKANTNKIQQWSVTESDPRIGGDYSFYDFVSLSQANLRMNVNNYSTQSGASIIAYSQNAVPTSNEQWYFQYAGNGYYFIRNRESALYLSSASSAKISGVKLIQDTLYTSADIADRQLWRILPAGVAYETVAPAKPSGLVAVAGQASVALQWEKSVEGDLDGYMVLRAEKETGQWNTIARKVQGTAYVDNTCRPGRAYIYYIKAIDTACNQSEPSEVAEATPTGEKGLVARWEFDGHLQDATPNMMDAAVYGTPAYQTDMKSGTQSLALNGSSYVQLPYEVAASEELTISMWVKWRSSTGGWQRLFDFGNGTSHYMFLTPSTGSTMRFAIKNGGDEQQVNCKLPLTVNSWKHVAVSIGKDKTTIYIDGEEAASSTGITISPKDIHPVLNYIGRSQFPADPFFNGYVDDVRIYNYALDGTELKRIMDDDTNGIDRLAAPEHARHPVYGLDGIRRGAVRSGIQIIDGKKVMK